MAKGKDELKRISAREMESYIQKAVDAGRAEGYIQARQKPDNAYKATEKRLYALPILRAKVNADMERLEELMDSGPQERSKDIVRFNKSGLRLTADEITEALEQDLRAQIAADRHEISILGDALKTIEQDFYFLAVSGKYIDEMFDDQIAETLACDNTTVWRNRKRLVQRLAVHLYGVNAVI